jgi:chemotaxis protein histidine kinase CheA
MATITYNMSIAVERAHQTMILSAVQQAVELMASRYGFDPEEALESMKVSRKSQVPKSKAVPKQKKLKPSIPIPYCGNVFECSCHGIRVNHGLHTQCTNDKMSDSTDYCKTCDAQAVSNGSSKPNAGDIRDRSSHDWVPSSKQVPYGNVMAKLGITRDEAMKVAAAFGVNIQEDQFEVVKGRRGRPKKDFSASSSDDETKPKRPRGRPKKSKPVISTSAGDDLISSLIASATAQSSSDSDTESVASTASSKAEESKEAKAVKDAEKAEAKEAKDAEKAVREAEKAAKAEAKAVKDAEKAEAKEAKDAEKAVREAEKAAKAEAKAVKDAEKAEAKEANDAEKAVREAEKAAKAEAKAVKDAEKAEAKASIALVKAEAKAVREAEKAAKAEAKAVKDAEKAEAKEAKDAEKAAKMEAKAADQKAVIEAVTEITTEAKELAVEELGTDDDDDEELVVEKFEHQGNQYLKEENGTLYHPDTHEEIGVWNEEDKEVILLTC